MIDDHRKDSEIEPSSDFLSDLWGEVNTFKEIQERKRRFNCSKGKIPYLSIILTSRLGATYDPNRVISGDVLPWSLSTTH